VGAALLSALVVVAAACSSNGSSTGSTSTTASSANNAAILGTKHPATGAPLKIGYIYAGQTQAIDGTPEINMAKATVKYVNEYLDGIAGRPIELDVCADQVTPAGATQCADQMLADKVPVVLQSQPGQPATVVRLLTPAKVPYFTYLGADVSLMESAVASLIGNPLIILAAPMKVAQDNGYKKVAMVYVDVPAAAELKTLGETLYTKNGLKLLPSAVPLGTPDVTPQVQAAISNGAQEFLVIGDNSLCVNTLKALKTLGFNGKVVINTNCLQGSGAQALSGGYEGAMLATIMSADPNDADVKLYHAVAATYTPSTATEGNTASAGFGEILGFVRAMTKLTANDATPAGITAALLNMPPEPMPLLPTQTFQCNRKAAPLTPGVCSNGAELVTLKANGEVQSSKSFNAGPYLNAAG
jgi:branched-chain amino acid transport system substrate-binding protein